MSNTGDLPHEFFHVRHSCGHAVYWSDAEVAMRTSRSSCPWCGAEDGEKVPANVAMLGDPKTGVHAFREKTPDGRVPWPAELSNVPEDIIVRHMADDSCCNG